MLESAGAHRSALALHIVDAAADAVVVFDARFRFIFANPAAERLLGFTGRELLGRSQWEAFPTTVGTPLETAYRRAMEERVPIGLESHDAPLNRWHDVQAIPSFDGGLIVRFRDITGSRRTGEALRLQAQILDQVHDSIVATGLDGRVTRWNKGAERLFGYIWRRAVRERS